MQRNAIEPILGALVLAAAAAFLFFAYHKAGERGFEGYTLTARFSAVVISGSAPGPTCGSAASMSARSPAL